MFRSFLGPFFITLFIAIFVLLMQWLWKYIDDLVGKGLEWTLIAQLLFWASTTMIPLALPLAILLSSIMTFGNLGENYELVALKSSGISLQKIMSPLIVTAIIISISAFYFSNNLLPYANLKMGSLLYDVREQKPALNIKEGIFYNGIDNYVIKVGKKDPDGVTVYNIMIYDHTSHLGNANLTVAEKGRMEMTVDKRYLIFSLTNGINYYERSDNVRSRKNHPLQRTLFKEEVRRFDLSAFSLTRTNEEFFKDNYQMMNISQLAVTHDSLSQRLDTLKKNYITSMVTNLKYYKKFYNKDSTVKDTLKSMSGDFISNFPKSEQIEIIKYALNQAQNIKDHVFYNNEDFQGRQKFINRHDIEWHRKFTLSFACLVLFFIGAPLGAIIRKGGLGLPVVVSVIFFVIYHVVSFTFEKMVRESVLPSYIGMWLPAIIFLPLGIFLTIKATRDSSLFDVDAYLSIFKKFFNKKSIHNSNPTT
ncbi:MAG TPA: LptF/LptG family permease [Bacteroidales bacterium]|nr:LptF/LptG family permease [Bacteroidales bacterium]HPS17495.1 LptF/LptG family permease [Bacteroidales bacterium]